MQRALRRYQNMLICSGMGVVAFGIWSAIKFILFYVFLNPPDLMALIDPAYVSPFMEKLAWVFYAFFLLLGLALELAIRLFIGLSARAEGRGKKKGKLYLVLAGLMVLLHIFSMSSFFWMLWHGGRDEDTTLSSLWIDFSSLVMLVELIFSAVKVKGLRKKLETG